MISPANIDFEPGFAAALMAKELILEQNAALQSRASTPMSAEAAHLYRIYMSTGAGGTDFSSIIRFIRGQEDQAQLPNNPGRLTMPILVGERPPGRLGGRLLFAC